MVFSGDVGNTNQPLLRDPQRVESADVLVIESTYGDRLHEKVRLDYPRALAEVLQRTLDRGGNVVIPSFAVGRTQEMLYFLRQIKLENLVHGHGDFPVYVDSPLANEATAVFLQANPDSLDDEARALIRAGVNPLWFDGLKTSVTAEESKAINFDKTPKVILSASGMCDAGRIRHHLKHNLWRKESTILFVGYQAEGTLGRQIVEGAKKVKLFGEDISVAAEVRVLPGVSGHADRDGLLAWLKASRKSPVACSSTTATTLPAPPLWKRSSASATTPPPPSAARSTTSPPTKFSTGRRGVPAQKAKARAREQRLCPPARRHRAPHARRPRLRGHGQQGACQVRQPGRPPRRRVGAVGESAPARGFQRSDIPPTFPTGKRLRTGRFFDDFWKNHVEIPARRCYNKDIPAIKW